MNPTVVLLESPVLDNPRSAYATTATSEGKGWTMNATKVRHKDSTFLIEEHDATMFGEHRFSLDYRSAHDEGVVLVNIGWFKTYRGAMNAMSMERSARGAQ